MEHIKTKNPSQKWKESESRLLQNNSLYVIIMEVSNDSLACFLHSSFVDYQTDNSYYMAHSSVLFLRLMY